MVFQDPATSLNPRRRIGDQISDGIATARARGAAGSTVEEWLERVGLPAEVRTRFPHQFSGGQKQRIAIARALAARPSLLVADEPISALDASTQTSVAGLMRDLVAESGAGMLFISHDLAVVRRIADRTFVMFGGRVLESGPTAELWAAPRHPTRRRCSPRSRSPTAPAASPMPPPPTTARSGPRCLRRLLTPDTAGRTRCSVRRFVGDALSPIEVFDPEELRRLKDLDAEKMPVGVEIEDDLPGAVRVAYLRYLRGGFARVELTSDREVRSIRFGVISEVHQRPPLVPPPPVLVTAKGRSMHPGPSRVSCDQSGATMSCFTSHSVISSATSTDCPWTVAELVEARLT